MSIATVVRYSCFAVMGGFLAHLGYGWSDWRLWAVLIVMAIAAEARKMEAK